MRFDYNDINLEPKMCIVDSRSECDTSVVLGSNRFKMPITPANMECVINEELAIKLASNGYFYVMHRFDVDQIAFIEKMRNRNLFSSISIGVNDDSYELVEEISDRGLSPDYITIDIAHGHAIKMKRMLQFLREKLPNTFRIAGNVSTQEAVKDLTEWGANAIKVGIGPGRSCTTYPATGFGSRNCQASIIDECSNISAVPIIADGGIRVPGDIAKSVVLGATMVMVGGMLSGLKDSPGCVVEIGEKKYKEYWGSASSFQSGKTNRIEGKKTLIELKDKTFLEELKYLEECLQSSISYGGGNKLDDLNGVSWFKV